MVKNFEDMFIRFEMIHELDRRTDRHRATAIAVLMHSIARQKWRFIFEMMPDTVIVTMEANTKPHPSFRMVPVSMTLSDL